MVMVDALLHSEDKSSLENILQTDIESSSPQIKSQG